MSLSKSKGYFPWWMFAVVTGLCAIAIAVGLLEAGNTEQGWRYVNRYLVRIGFPLFVLSFVASSLVALWPGKATHYLRRNRRYLGLNFAIAHFTHLFAIVMLFNITGENIALITLLGGGGTYVLLALMTLTSNNYSVKKLGNNWFRLHKVGTYALWLIFTQSYVGRVFGTIDGVAASWAFMLPAAFLIAALGLRIVAKYRRSHGQAQPA